MRFVSSFFWLAFCVVLLSVFTVVELRQVLAATCPDTCSDTDDECDTCQGNNWCSIDGWSSLNYQYYGGICDTEFSSNRKFCRYSYGVKSHQDYCPCRCNEDTGRCTPCPIGTVTPTPTPSDCGGGPPCTGGQTCCADGVCRNSCSCPPDKPNCTPIGSGSCQSGIKGNCSDGYECCPNVNPPKDCVGDYGSRGFSCQQLGQNGIPGQETQIPESCTPVMGKNREWRIISEDITTGNTQYTVEARGSCGSNKTCVRQCDGSDVPTNMCIININPDNETDLGDPDRYDVQVWNFPVAYGGPNPEGACEAANGGSCSCRNQSNVVKMSLNYNPSTGAGTWESAKGCVSDLNPAIRNFSCTRSECRSNDHQPDESGAVGFTDSASGQDWWSWKWKYEDVGGKICCDAWREDTASDAHHPMCSTPGTVTGTVDTPRVYSDGLEATAEKVRFKFIISGRDNMVSAPASAAQGEAIRLHEMTFGQLNTIIWAEPGSNIGVANNGDNHTHECTYTVGQNRLVWEFECKIPWGTSEIGRRRTLQFATKYNEVGTINYEVVGTSVEDTFCRDSVVDRTGYVQTGQLVTYSRGTNPIDWATWMKSVAVGSGGETVSQCGEGNAETCSVTANLGVGSSLYFYTDISKMISSNLYVCGGANSAWMPAAPLTGAICNNACKVNKIEICEEYKDYIENRPAEITRYCNGEVVGGRVAACGAGKRWQSTMSCLAGKSRVDPSKAVWARYYDTTTSTCKDPWCTCQCVDNNLPVFSDFKIKNVSNVEVVAETGNRNHICQLEFTNSRKVIFEATITDADGISDIDSVLLEWGAKSYAMSLSGTIARVTVDFPASDNGGGAKDLKVVVTDKSGAVNANQDTGRDFKVWNCEVAITGKGYDGSGAAHGIPSCSTRSGFSSPITTGYGLVYKESSGDKTMKVAVPDYTSDVSPLIWGKNYSYDLSGVSGLPPKMCIGSALVTEIGTTLASAYGNTPSLTADFSVVLDQDAWYQVVGGGVRAGERITDEIPVTCPAGGSPLTCAITIGKVGADNGLVAAKSQIDKGCFDCKYGSPNNFFESGRGINPVGIRQYGYRYFSDRLAGRLVGLQNYSVGTSLSKIGVGTTGVVLVDGDVTIDQDNTVAMGKFLMVVAGGEMVFLPSVTKSEGVFVANNINIGGSSATDLNIDGLVYATGGDITITRSFTNMGINNTTPATVFNYRPDFVFSMPSLIYRLVSGWKYN